MSLDNQLFMTLRQKVVFLPCPVEFLVDLEKIQIRTNYISLKRKFNGDYENQQRQDQNFGQNFIRANI